MGNIKLKNILAENMRRFGTKNLNEQFSSDNFEFAKKQSYNSIMDIMDAAEDLATEDYKIENLPIYRHAIKQLTIWTNAKKPAPLSVYMLVAEAPALLDKMQSKSKKAWEEMRSHWGGIIDDIADEDEDEYVTDYKPQSDDMI
jgi:hypothetical protein